MIAFSINGANLIAACVALTLATVSAIQATTLNSLLTTTSEQSERPTTASAPDASSQQQRIASASVIADELLLALCDPARIVAFTEYNQKESIHAERFSGKKAIRNLEDIETIASLKPDLVIAHEVSDRRQIERLNELGIDVLDLGTVTGVQSLLKNISDIGAAVGNVRGAERMRGALERRIITLAELATLQPRRTALVVFHDGKRLYAAGGETSYSDILWYAGLQNLLTDRFSGVQEINSEVVIGSAPDFLVTDTLSAPHLCRIAGWESLRYCIDARTMIIIDERELANAGLDLPDTIDLVRAARSKR